MNILFIFLDGVGLGKDDPEINPFVSALSPTFDNLLSGKKLLAKNTPLFAPYCTLLGIDAQMGVDGLPQSATGQATLLTGVNFPKLLGYHYGPKPNKEISEYFILNGINKSNNNRLTNPKSIFTESTKSGKHASLLNAYPQSYFDNINSKKRNHSVIPLAATTSGIRLKDQNDLIMGKALSADFTGQGWLDHLNINNTPIISPIEAGILMASLSKEYRLSMFEYWETDIIGHKQNIHNAIKLIGKLDHVMEGLLINWDIEKDGILLTSDHGNMEDLSTRRHTTNRVPALFIGPPAVHKQFYENVKCIGDIAPFINKLLNNY